LKTGTAMNMTPASRRSNNSICSSALKEGDRLRIGHWEFRTDMFHETPDTAVKTTGVHTHETFYELSMMNLGTMEYRIKDRIIEIDAKRKDWVLIPAGQAHRRTCLNPPTVILGFLFEAECFRESSWPIQRLNREIEKAGYHFSGTPALNKAQSELFEELSSDRALKTQRVSLLIKDLQLCFIREYLPFLSEDYPAERNDSELALRIINSYIDENISRNLALDEIASCCGLSARHANRIFTRENGISLGRHVQEKRMKIARRNVEDTSRQIKDIALELGYDDISYFNRIFRKTFSMTPMECRKKRV